MIGNNDENDKDVKKNAINEDADKSDSEKFQEAAFRRRHRSRSLFVTLFVKLVGSGLAELAANLRNLRGLFQVPELNYCTLTQSRRRSSNVL